MTNSNKMYHVKRKIADFDACSLYPSAMNRMLGYLIGKPKILNQSQLNYKFLKNTDGYFIRIKITKVGKFRQFPLMSKYNDNVKIPFTPQPPPSLVGSQEGAVILDRDLLPRLDVGPGLQPQHVVGVHTEPGVADTAVVAESKGGEHSPAVDT